MTVTVTTSPRSSHAPAVPATYAPVSTPAGTVTIPTRSAVSGDGSTPCLLCMDTGTTFGWPCPVDPITTGTARSPIAYAIEFEQDPGRWAIARQGLIDAGTPTLPVLDAVVASLALAQLAAAGPTRPLIRVSAAAATSTGVALTAYEVADPECGVVDSFVRLGALLERAAEARRSDA